MRKLFGSPETSTLQKDNNNETVDFWKILPKRAFTFWHNILSHLHRRN
jgi:hypothetical protein